MNLARWGSLPDVLVFVIIGVALIAMSVIIIVDKISQVRLVIYSVVVWVLLVVLLYTTFALNIHTRASNELDIAIMVLFFTYFMIPLTLRVTTTLSVILSIIHLLVSTTVAIDTTPADILGRQFASHFLLLLGMNLIGIYYNYLAELAQRKTFSGTRRYIRSLVSIEEQKRKKVSCMV